MTSVFVAGLLALIESVNFLSVLSSSLTTALFVLAMAAPAVPSWHRQLFEAVTAPFLVATGLCLILIQIVKRKPISWLVAANAISLALVLYGGCFINAPRLVAAYNVAYSREAGGIGPWLDKDYLRSLGPEVLPVLEPSLPPVPALQSTALYFRSDRDICQNRRRRSENRRATDFRTWRLDRYLANNPDMTQNPLDGGKG